MTQKERILEYLQTHGTIQPLQAWTQVGVYRLAAAIKRLRDDGHNIITQKTKAKNRFGESVVFAEYKLVENVAETYSEAA